MSTLPVEAGVGLRTERQLAQSSDQARIDEAFATAKQIAMRKVRQNGWGKVELGIDFANGRVPKGGITVTDTDSC